MDDTGGLGVVISDGRCGVRLVKAGEAHEIGDPTIIGAWAGPFSGTVRDDTVGGYASFLDQLSKLHGTLVGEARLTSYGGFSLTLSGNGRGAIEVNVEVVGEHVPLIRLTYGFCIDQSYLPAIIQSIKREFAPAPPS